MHAIFLVRFFFKSKETMNQYIESKYLNIIFIMNKQINILGSQRENETLAYYP